MGDGYDGLGSKNRSGCLTAAVVGCLALFFDLGRFMGDPAPGTENWWWRSIPVFVPTLAIAAATFVVCRFVKQYFSRHDR
ncbi:hypothetical protein Q4610_07830 [Sphingobium sp. HBC34]|uniref:Uncharacterized protein n=1 Tax=Sphingobium cyanobacteriorum TaxID=3063954 RepID=A0ABT8ZN69_9SPHN|nr:hypothetical protein [Sphingobium sp. HBC34]MDO7834956.1 hypothetical protein [Sphingobium sp. HBC34]